MAFYKLVITKRKGTGDKVLQFSELNFFDKNSNKISWSVANIQCNMTGVNTSESIDKIIDGNTSTKFCTGDWGSGLENECIITIQVNDSMDMPAYYSYVTSNDSPNRDPVSWTLSYSKDGTEYTIISEVTDASITGNRNAETQLFEVIEPVIIKFLIAADGAFYTVNDGNLVDLEVTDITAELFKTQGMEEPPASDILLTLTNPKVLAWNNKGHRVRTAAITATPYPQTLYSPDYDMTDASILGIEKVIAEASDDVTFAISFDSGETWKYYTGTDWATLSEETSGMSVETIMSVPTDKWAEVATGTFKVRATLPSIESTLSRFVVDYLNA